MSLFMSWQSYFNTRWEFLPVRKSGMETKNPPMAQTLVEAAPFKYLVVLKNEGNFFMTDRSTQVLVLQVQ